MKYTKKQNRTLFKLVNNFSHRKDLRKINNIKDMKHYLPSDIDRSSSYDSSIYSGS